MSLSRNGHLGKQHSSVTLELRCRCASGPHVFVGANLVFAPPMQAITRIAPTKAQGNANGDFPTGTPCIWPFLNRLQRRAW